MSELKKDWIIKYSLKDKSFSDMADMINLLKKIGKITYLFKYPFSAN